MEVRVSGSAFGVFGRDSERQSVGETEANEAFGWDLHLLAACDGVCTGSDAAACSGSDGGSFATAEDASKDSADGCTTANFFGGVFAAALAFYAVGVSGDREFFAATVDAGEFDGEERVAFVVSRFLNGRDAACDRRALTDGDEAVDDDVGGDGAGEAVTLLGRGAVEGLGDADRDGGIRLEGDVTECGGRGWWRRRWWREFLRWRWWGSRYLRGRNVSGNGFVDD